MRKSLLSFSFVWFILSVVLCVLLIDSSKGTHTALVLMVAISYGLCIYSWLKAGCRAVSIYTFFVLYAFLCNCAQSVLYIIGVPSDFLTAYNNVTFSQVTSALRFQLLCIAALNVGTCMALSREKYCVSMSKQSSWYKNVSYIANKHDKTLLILLFVLLLGSVYGALEIARVRSTMSYHEWMYEGFSTVDSRFYFTYFYLFLSLRFVFKKQYVLLIYLSWLFFIGLFMMLGLRSQAIPYVTMFVVTLPVTHSRLFQKRFILLWIVGVFFGIIFLGLISATRDNESVNLSEASTNQGVAISFYSSLADIGSSGKTIAYTMELCDKGVPHYQSILYSVLSVVPQRVLKIPIGEIFGVEESLSSPGGYISHAQGIAGAGFSFIAEAYLNYGWFGCFFILVYGFIIARMENLAYLDFIHSGSFFKITFLLYLARQVFYARGDLCLGEIYIEYMMFTAIIYILLKKKEKLFTL